MSSINLRLKEFCNSNSIRQTDLVNKGFGSTQTVSNIFNNRQLPPLRFIERFIKEYPGIDLYYLMTGENKSEYKLNEPQAIYGKTNNKLLNYIDRLEKDIKRIEMECEELKKQVVKPGT